MPVDVTDLISLVEDRLVAARADLAHTDAVAVFADQLFVVDAARCGLERSAGDVVAVYALEAVGEVDEVLAPVEEEVLRLLRGADRLLAREALREVLEQLLVAVVAVREVVERHKALDFDAALHALEALLVEVLTDSLNDLLRFDQVRADGAALAEALLVALLVKDKIGVLLDTALIAERLCAEAAAEALRVPVVTAELEDGALDLLLAAGAVAFVRVGDAPQLARRIVLLDWDDNGERILIL